MSQGVSNDASHDAEMLERQTPPYGIRPSVNPPQREPRALCGTVKKKNGAQENEGKEDKAINDTGGSFHRSKQVPNIFCGEIPSNGNRSRTKCHCDGQ